MKSHTGDGRTSILAALSVLALGAITCNALPIGLGRQEPEARIATLESELREARRDATAEAEGGPAPAEDEREAGTVQEDFEGEATAFQLGEGAALDEGALLLGPFEECANDVANFDAPIGCIVVCETCGRTLSSYHMRVGFSFEDGLSDREFGVILRLADEDGDSLLDREDYLLALGFNIFENRWRVYLHEPDKLEPWRRVSSGQAGFLLPGRTNVLDVTVTDDGRRMEIRLNDRQLDLLTGGEAEPNERSVAPWIDAGAVGLIGLGRGVQARFDDFILEPSP
jgi:hypothetical protein